MGIFAVFAGSLKAVGMFIKGLKMVPKVATALKGAAIAKNFILKRWKISLIAVLAALLIAGTWLHNKEVDRLETHIFQYQADAQEYERTQAANDRAINECITINRENARAYVQAQLEADEAVLRVESLLAQQNEQVEVIHEEVSSLRGRDEDCRSLDDPLPDWFDEWLRQ